LKSGTTHHILLCTKIYREEIDDTSTPSTTHAGMNDILPREESFQPVIHEEASTYHDADEEPTIADVALFCP
jgi:hypothetical protein